MPLLPGPTIDFILRNLTPVQRIRYSLSCREAYASVKSFDLKAFQIEKVYRRWFPNSVNLNEFRMLQYRYGILVSGSVAVQFFGCIVFDTCDLDLYVHRDAVLPLRDFLLQIGYRHTSTNDREEEHYANFFAGQSVDERNHYRTRGILTVFNFMNSGEKIQVIVTRKSPMDVILRFHCTAVMNVITHSHAYALYPHATYNHKCAVRLPFGRGETIRIRDDFAQAVRKWMLRGWNCVDLPSAVDYLRSGSEFFEYDRCVGDSFCWTIALSPILGLQHALMALQKDPVRGNSWYQRLEHNSFVIEHCNISNPIFKGFGSWYTAKFLRRMVYFEPELDDVDPRDVYTFDNCYAAFIHDLMPNRGFDMSFEIDSDVRLGFLKAPRFPGVSYEDHPTAMVALMVHWYMLNLTNVLSYRPLFSLQFIVRPFPSGHQKRGYFVQTIILVQLKRGWGHRPGDLFSLELGLSPHNIETHLSFSL